MQPEHSFFVGIDSDGCIFDTMEIKHKECFTPNIIKHWGLQSVSKYAREASEFVNLYSKWRGVNRWPALVMVLDLLRDRPEVQARGAHIPEVPKVREFIDSGLPLSNGSLAKLVAETGDPELRCALDWSEAVNATIADMVYGVAPFSYVRESLELITQHADAIVVSQTPVEALVREWQEHDIDCYVRVIAGQELPHLRVIALARWAEAAARSGDDAEVHRLIDLLLRSLESTDFPVALATAAVVLYSIGATGQVQEFERIVPALDPELLPPFLRQELTAALLKQRTDGGV